MNKKPLTLASTLLLAGTLAQPVFAYDDLDEVTVAPAAAKAKAGGFVGLGVISKPDYEGSDKTEIVVAPFGRYNWANGRFVSLGGTGGSESAGRLRANIIKRSTNEHLSFGPLVQYRVERSDVDTNQVDRMKKVDAATELGAFVGCRYNRWNADLSFAADVSDEHNGSLIYLKGGYDLIRDPKTLLLFSVNATWADSDYMDTYFGVNAKNRGSSTLPDYKAESGFKNVGATLTGLYRFTQSWGVAASIAYTSMLNDAKDSPLVDGKQGVGDKGQVNAILAATYSF